VQILFFNYLADQNMKHIKYTLITASIFLLTGFAGCKKSFLEVVPKGRLINQKLSDYSLSLNSLNLLNMSTPSQVALGDEIAAQETFFNAALLRNQRFFRYDDVIYEPDEDALETAVPLRAIYLYNMVINEVLDATEGTEQEKKSIQAEALAGRAWTYFLLINFYGKPYSEATAATDPGFPIVKEADVAATKFTRASVKEVYDFIVQDLTMALVNLPAQTTHRLRMSRAAARTLLGKVYLFMGKPAEALPLLNGAITDIAASAIAVKLYNYNVAFGTGGIFLPITTAGATYPTVVNNEENIYAKQFGNNWTSVSNEFVVTKQTADLFTPSDLRKNFYKTTPSPSGTAYPLGMLRRIGPSGTTQFGVIVPDLYLLRAECKARLNDLSGAKTDIEEFRANRMSAADKVVPTATAASQVLLLKFIFDERIREFAMQGFRWFDMRRLSVDPLFPGLIFTHTVYSVTGTVVATYPLKPERLTLRIPQKLIDQNPGMINNP
jgi:hypothetical protein